MDSASLTFGRVIFAVLLQEWKSGLILFVYICDVNTLKGIVLSLVLFLGIYTLNAGPFDGMIFRSYEVPAEHRTSMVVSGTQDEPMAFSDSLTFSFSLKFELDKGKFGYIFRLALDSMLPIDFLLSPENGRPVLCVTADHRNIIPLNDTAGNPEEWNDIHVSVADKGDSIVFSMNRTPVFALPSQCRRHHAKIYFGKVDASGMVTSDVAPMLIADLHVCKDGRKKASWNFWGAEDMGSKKGISVTASNYDFISVRDDRWTKVWSLDLPSASYICVSQDVSKFYIISSDRIVECDAVAVKNERHLYSTDMNMRNVAGEFLCLQDGTLCYADMETGNFIRYDLMANEWAAPNGKKSVSVHLHHNTVYIDGVCYQMFGYGQHRYSDKIFTWTPSGELVDSLSVEGVAPRYLAGAAAKDGRIYVLGGKGNAAGLQKLGTQYYDDFIEIDPVAGTSHTLWQNPLLRSCVPARDLVFEENGNSFLALLYNPEATESSLSLTRFNIGDGTSKTLVSSIPYRFADTCSEARFCYNEESNLFFAILCYRSENGQYKADIYVLGNPVAVCTETCSDYLKLILLPIASVLLLAGIWLSIRRRRPRRAAGEINPEPEPEAVISEPEPVSADAGRKSPGIYMLGGFHAVDKNGADITSSFSPILLQLLSIFVLYTAEKNGLTNAMLKELLWPDKSDDSFNNNKGVNVRKLRKLLAGIGDISIVSDTGVWTIKDESGLCDYMVAVRQIRSGRCDDIINAAMRGPLLPEYHFDWMDSFKAGYADMVISALSGIVSDVSSPERLVKVADARLKFDSLDEKAVMMKCRAYISMGKAGTAKAVFEHFIDEYNTVMGEQFGTGFSEFLKKNQH